jgi:hypothetical protein
MVLAGGALIENGVQTLFNQNQQTADQQRLKDLVNEATNTGRKPLSVNNANTVLDWAKEYNHPGVRAGAGGVTHPSNWTGNNGQPHINTPGAGRSAHVSFDRGVSPRP